MANPLAGKRVAFIGGGAMAEAIIKGALASGALIGEEVAVSDPVAARLKHLKKTYGARPASSNAKAIEGADAVVIAVKPQAIEAALAPLARRKAEPLFVSIAAGVPLARLAALLGEGARLVRAMPNTPALALAGATALYAGPEAREKDRALAQAIFEAVGVALYVGTEALLDAVTGLSGSGPAFVLTFLEALSDAGVRAGLGRAEASRLAAQTVYGSAKMALESEKNFAGLREMVTSPGGTTIAGLQALEERGFRGAVMGAVEAAVKRARELGG